MSKLLEFFTDDSGVMSANRLAFILWIVGVLIVWMITSLTSHSMSVIPESIIVILSVLMTGKVVQKAIEVKKDKE